MTPIAAPTYLTPEAYLELERKATTKNEYVDGEIILMGGCRATAVYPMPTIFTARLQTRQI